IGDGVKQQTRGRVAGALGSKSLSLQKTRGARYCKRDTTLTPATRSIRRSPEQWLPRTVKHWLPCFVRPAGLDGGKEATGTQMLP
ncbi:unnamed protein product, partial [Ectocarpus sp. 12 AP-2014]